MMITMDLMMEAVNLTMGRKMLLMMVMIMKMKGRKWRWK